MFLHHVMCAYSMTTGTPVRNVHVHVQVYTCSSVAEHLSREQSVVGSKSHLKQLIFLWKKELSRVLLYCIALPCCLICNMYYAQYYACVVEMVILCCAGISLC